MPQEACDVRDQKLDRLKEWIWGQAAPIAPFPALPPAMQGTYRVDPWGNVVSMVTASEAFSLTAMVVDETFPHSRGGIAATGNLQVCIRVTSLGPRKVGCMSAVTSLALRAIWDCMHKP